MWCIYMCPCVSCRVVMLFTCTLVRSHPDSKEGIRCEIRSEIWDKQQDTGLDMATRCMLGEGGQKETQSKPGTRPWRAYWQGAARRWLFKYVQVIITVCVLTCMITVCSLSMPYDYLWLGNWFTLLTAVYFCRLKINHDSHEFILESGTVANKYIAVTNWNKL